MKGPDVLIGAAVVAGGPLLNPGRAHAARPVVRAAVENAGDAPPNVSAAGGAPRTL